MKTYKHFKKNTIEAKIAEIWPTADREIRIYADYVEIELTAMYEPPGCSFSQLKALSEFFGTEDIRDTGSIRDGGCETCDYGSKYGFTLRIE